MGKIHNDFEDKSISQKEVKELDEFESFINEITLKEDDLNIEINYLLDNFLIENSLNMFFASAGSGKSLLTLSIATKLLREDKVKKVFYLDMDNGLTSLKKRNVTKFTKEFEDRLNYISRIKLKITYFKLLEKFTNKAKEKSKHFDKSLIVIDSIRNFFKGDMNSDKDVIVIMEMLSALIDDGATVIFMHHISKGGKENKEAKGSTAFRDSTEYSYYVELKPIKNNSVVINLEVDKDRDKNSNEKISFELDITNMDLKEVDSLLANINDKESEFISSIKSVLSSKGELSQSELLKEIGKDKGDKTSISLLNKFSGKFWSSKKGDKNATIYYLI